MRIYLFLISIFAFIAVLQINVSSEEIQKKTINKNTKIDDKIFDIDWSKTDPIRFISILKQNKDKWITVNFAPKDWIQKKHIDHLIKLIDSKEPVAPVVSMVSSYLPFNKTSTVGNEVMFIIEGFIKGRYPPGICSVYTFKGDPKDYKNWYSNHKKN